MFKPGEGFIDMTGQRFGRLTVLRVNPVRKGRAFHWFCRCDCGVERSISGAALRRSSKPTRSCGCIWESPNKTHGQSLTNEYKIWASMKARCFSPNSKPYRYYGGRGITMAPEWKDDFLAFMAHIGPRPGPEYSVDRIDNNGNYEPGNVRWATGSEQVRNRRVSTYVQMPDGERLHCIDAAKAIGIPFEAFRGRLRAGMTAETGLFMPPGTKKVRHSKLTELEALEIKRRLREGQTQRAIAADYGVSQTHISHINLGKSWYGVLALSQEETK